MYPACNHRFPGPLAPSDSKVDALSTRTRNAERFESDLRVLQIKQETLAKEVDKIKKEATEGSRRLTAVEDTLAVCGEPVAPEGNSGKGIFENGLIPRVSGLEDHVRNAGYRLITQEQYMDWNDRILDALWKTFTADNLPDKLKQADLLRTLWKSSVDHFAARRKATPSVDSPIVPRLSYLRASANPFVSSLNYGSSIAATKTSTAN